MKDSDSIYYQPKFQASMAFLCNKAELWIFLKCDKSMCKPEYYT